MTDKMIVKFAEIARLSKASVDRENNPYSFYVEGGHMDSEDLRIRRRGVFSDDYVGPAFHRIFKKGQVLYGSRRTYLKKIAVADFDGITANTTFVLDAISSPYFKKDLLPYIMVSDSFTKHAVLNSKGSTNPYINWPDIAKFELKLPSIGEQEVLLSLLDSNQKVEDHLFSAISSHQVSMRRLFMDSFGGPNKSWNASNIGELFEVQLGKMLSKKAQQGANPKKYLGNINVQWGHIDISDLKEMDFSDKEIKKFSLKKNDILVCEGGEIGRAAIWDENLNDCYYQKALHRLRLKLGADILPEYMLLWLEYKFRISNDFKSESLTTTIAHIPREKLLKLVVSYPDVNTQRKIVAAFGSMKSIEKELNEKLKNIRKLRQSILNRYFDV